MVCGRTQPQHFIPYVWSRFALEGYATVSGESTILRFEMLPTETTIKVTLSFDGSGSHLRRREHGQNWHRDWMDLTDL